jgi:hypothetical protein
VTEHDRLHERAQREADDLEQRGEKLGEEIDRTRQDWESKKGDQSVPGAQPEDAAEEEDRADQDGPPPEADVITPGD